MDTIKIQEELGAVTRFYTITTKQLHKITSGEMNETKLKHLLNKYHLRRDKIIHDQNRQLLHTYYCDYKKGIYGQLCGSDFAEDSPTLQRLSNMVIQGNNSLRLKSWYQYYGIDHELMIGFLAPSEVVPVPMLIYDFSRRLKELPQEEIFEIWKRIYKKINYANGMWKNEVLDYVFQNRPALSKLPLNKDGTLTIYRGMGKRSQPPEKAMSWSTNRINALYFATHCHQGTGFVSAQVSPEDVIAYFPTFKEEHEVIVRPDKLKNIQFADMIPVSKKALIKMVEPALHDFIFFGYQIKNLGYQIEGWFQYHGQKHILRVLLLSLIYYYNSDDKLTEADRNILIYFSLMHDCGRIGDSDENNHGFQSLTTIDEKGYQVKGLNMMATDTRIARLLIAYHSQEDSVGLSAISSDCFLSSRNKMRAQHLYLIAKDMDGLDRVRFHGLDYTLLRMPFSRRLPLIAGSLLAEDVLKIIEM